MNTKDNLNLKIRQIKDPNLRNSCVKILEDERFFIWPASLSYHHSYAGGLAAHTLEVWELSDLLANTRFIQVSDKDVIAATCIWHDFLKTEEYLLANSPIPNQRFLPYEDKFFVKKAGEDSGHSHIVNGAEAFKKEAEKNGVDESLIHQIEHCLLSHHGFVKEWGSMVAPKTLEAMIVHFADMLSVKAGISK